MGAMASAAAHTMAGVMIIGETASGTPVVDLIGEEYDTYLEGEVRRGTNLTVAEFIRAHAALELDDADPVVGDLVGLLRIGQGGNRRA